MSEISDLEATVNTARHTSIGFVATFTADITVNSVSGSATGDLRISRVAIEMS